MQDNTLTPEVQAQRTAGYDIHPLFLNRWSPRSMTSETLSDEELMPLFEAARWAPSSYNNQPWRFIIARRENTEAFQTFFNLLVSGNQVWCKNAAVLVVVASRTVFDHNGKPSATHAFDTGSAWENLALEAARRGLVAHGMQGFDYARAKTELKIPDDYDVMAMIAIGKRGSKENLPEDLQKVEMPNGRKPLEEILFEGEFGKLATNMTL